MSQNFFEVHHRGFEAASKKIKLQEVFSSKQFKNVYEAILSSLVILGAGAVVSFALSAMSSLLSTLLAAAAAAMIVATICRLLPPEASTESITNFAILAIASALLVNVLPYFALIGFGGLAISKFVDLVKQDEPQIELSNFWTGMRSSN